MCVWGGRDRGDRSGAWGGEEREREEEEEERESRRVKGGAQRMYTETSQQTRVLPAYWACTCAQDRCALPRLQGAGQCA